MPVKAICGWYLPSSKTKSCNKLPIIPIYDELVLKCLFTYSVNRSVITHNMLPVISKIFESVIHEQLRTTTVPKKLYFS